MLSQDEINRILTNAKFTDDVKKKPGEHFSVQIFDCDRSYQTFYQVKEEEKTMDYILMPELKSLHKTLREEEKNLSPEDKKTKHMELAKHCEAIIRYSNIARKEGLLSLEEAAYEMKNEPETAFDRELILMIVDGCDPEMVQRVILMKYFSAEQNVYQAIKNIMSIYGLLSVQAGENPRFIMQMLKNMIPDDVGDIAVNICYQEQKNTDLKEVNIDDYCVGEIRLRENDLGYFETKLCEETLLSLNQRALQRVLRDISLYDLAYAMQGFSGACRRHIFNNLSSRVAQDLARKLRVDNPSDDSTYYLHSEWTLNQVRKEVINILSTINRLETSGEIVFSNNSSTRFLSLVMNQITVDEHNRKKKAKEYDLLIEAIRNYMKCELGIY